jgi:hypothetical protein
MVTSEKRHVQETSEKWQVQWQSFFQMDTLIHNT